jgi:hypothetical protein
MHLQRKSDNFSLKSHLELGAYLLKHITSDFGRGNPVVSPLSITMGRGGDKIIVIQINRDALGTYTRL